ncbi:hypothetical protein [Methylosinus sporium]|uniref:hypothetical protein n=1 Tax=Methylosinus sporium TaxID=428 RepID=UPI00383A9BBF
MSATPKSFRVVVLVKATPNPSRKYGETVCCAGVTADGQWKRLYPVRFRHLQDNKFKRWDWVNFQFRPPTGDHRPESCHVFEDRIEVDGSLGERERVTLLSPLILPSTREATARGLSLTLIRPTKSKFKYRRKSPEIVATEREAYRYAARQMSLLDKELEAFEPLPYAFAFSYEDAYGKHTMQCGDWETSATFWRHRKMYGEQAALDHLSKTFNEEYPRKGMVFAMGTIRKRPSQWMLLGVIRLDELRQESFQF